MPPRVFRHLARSVTRGQLADRDAVPIILAGVGLVDTATDGRPLRAVVTEATISVQLQDGSTGLVDRTIVIYSVADLPRAPKKSDVVLLDGERHPIGETKGTRAVGLVDCYLSG